MDFRQTALPWHYRLWLVRNMISKLQKQIENNSALMVESDINRLYLTGEDTTGGIFLLTNTEAFLIIDARYYESVRTNSSFTAILTHGKYVDTLQDFLGNNNIKSLLFEEAELSCKKYSRLTQTLGLPMIPCGDMVTSLRAVKSENEIDAIHKSQKICEKAFEETKNFITVGKSEKEIALHIRKTVISLGAEDVSFSPIVASGINSAIPHHRPGNKKIEENDIIIIDMGAKCNHYCSDMTRTIFVGQPSDKQVEIYNLVLKAQENAISSLRAGISCNDGDFLARSVIEKYGYGENFTHSLGHGIGLQIHEAPRMVNGESDLLQVNNVLSVEPGIYLPRQFGVRIEDLCVIKEQRVENLTSTPKSLISL